MSYLANDEFPAAAKKYVHFRELDAADCPDR